jgi:hypothetical protein
VCLIHLLTCWVAQVTVNGRMCCLIDWTHVVQGCATAGANRCAVCRTPARRPEEDDNCLITIGKIRESDNAAARSKFGVEQGWIVFKLVRNQASQALVINLDLKQLEITTTGSRLQHSAGCDCYFVNGDYWRCRSWCVCILLGFFVCRRVKC